MSINLALAAELELRRRKKTGKVLTAPARWDQWLKALFPTYFSAPFAERHAEMWEWVESIQEGGRPSPFFGIWGRGGGKSQNAEGAVIRVAARQVRKYAWYISATQDQADQHVDTIGSMLEASETGKYYPDLSDRAVNKFGSSKGWRRQRLRTASGFTIDAMGLDTGARGAKIEEHRPDFIVIDDIDGLFDSAQSTLKKLRILAQSILPAGSTDCAVLFIQNLITPDSVASRLLDGRADILSDKIVSGPYPAIDNLEVEQIDGRYIITGGEPTWEGQDLDVCQQQIFTWGYSAFMQESQHDVDKSGGIWKHVEWQHVEYNDLPEFVRTAVWVDPAVSSTDESDSMGISAGGITTDNKIIGLYWWEDITSPEDALERAIEKAVEVKSLTVGVETDQGGDTWRTVFNVALKNVQERYKKNMTREEYSKIAWPQFTSDKAGSRDEKTGKAYGSKVERNAKMLTAYESGLVYHQTGTHKTIEKALKRFPNTPLDVADSWWWCWHDLTRNIPLDWAKDKKRLGKVEGFQSRWVVD
jgi:hypothetical protein